MILLLELLSVETYDPGELLQEAECRQVKGVDVEEWLAQEQSHCVHLAELECLNFDGLHSQVFERGLLLPLLSSVKLATSLLTLF